MFTFIAIILLSLLIFLVLLLFRISGQLEKINRLNTMQLAYYCNPDAMLRATNSDSILRNAFKSSQEQIDPKKKRKIFLKLISNLAEL
tara:strand:- start:1330 stop:1593 length:264 start_codon:yes stop_codon:yes gene_type:complete